MTLKYVNMLKVKPSGTILPKISEYAKGFDGTKQMSCLIKDDELLKKYDKIWDKVSNSIKKDLLVNQ